MVGKSYQEWQAEEQRKFNALPIYWAFSDKQFEEVCERVGASGPDDFYTHKSLGGGFYLKSDADVVREYLTQPSELPELMKDYKFAKGAFLYEMGNHEYQFDMGQSNWEVFDCFGDCEYDELDRPSVYMDQLGLSDEARKAFVDARREFFKLCDENGWW